MSKAQKRSAARTEKFWFRKNIASTSKTTNDNLNNSNDDAMYIPMSIDEIINGKVKLYYIITRAWGFLILYVNNSRSHSLIRLYLL